MRDEFEVGTTWINKANERSIKAHARLGFEALGEFESNDNRRVLLRFETRQ